MMIEERRIELRSYLRALSAAAYNRGLALDEIVFLEMLSFGADEAGEDDVAAALAPLKALEAKYGTMDNAPDDELGAAVIRASTSAAAAAFRGRLASMAPDEERVWRRREETVREILSAAGAEEEEAGEVLPQLAGATTAVAQNLVSHISWLVDERDLAGVLGQYAPAGLAERVREWGPNTARHALRLFEIIARDSYAEEFTDSELVALCKLLWDNDGHGADFDPE